MGLKVLIQGFISCLYLGKDDSTIVVPTCLFLLPLIDFLWPSGMIMGQSLTKDDHSSLSSTIIYEFGVPLKNMKTQNPNVKITKCSPH